MTNELLPHTMPKSKIQSCVMYTLYSVSLCSMYVDAFSRAAKSPDLAGDLPIFDKIMKISRSPDLE